MLTLNHAVNYTNCHQCVYYLNCFCQCRYCIYRDATTVPGNNLYTCKGSFSVSSEGPLSRVTTVSGVGNSRRRVFAQNVEILLILMHLSILILGG